MRVPFQMREISDCVFLTGLISNTGYYRFQKVEKLRIAFLKKGVW